MKLKPILIASTWAASLAAAFFLGQGNGRSNEAAKLTEAQTAQASTHSSANISGKGGSAMSAATSARSRLESSPLVKKGSSATDAIADITRGEDPIERTNALLALIDTLAPDDFEGVVAAFRELGMTEARRAEYAMLLTAWAKVNPVAALTYSKENTRGTFASNTILATWAASNPDGALAWAKENHEGEGENPHLVGVIKGLATQDVNRATEIMSSMERSRERGDAIRAISDMLVASDPEAAKVWTQTIDDEWLRSGAVSFTAEKLAEKNPSAAANWLSDLSDTEAINRVGERIAAIWYRQDSDVAAKWATSLPPAAMGQPIAGIAELMVQDDPTGAAEWVSQLSQRFPDANYESAIVKIIRGSSQRDPLLAAEWISAVGDERSRGRYYHWILGQWQTQDSAAASQWIQSNAETLPKHIRQRFSNQMPES